MRIFKVILWPVLLLALLIALSVTMDYLLVPYQYARVKVHEIENVTYEDLILGTSHGASAVDPEVLTAVTGRSAYNAAMGGECPEDSFYLLRDAVEAGHKPGRVIYECDPTYLCISSDMNQNRAYLFRCMKNSLTKLSYYKNIMLGEDFRWSFCLWSYYLDNMDRISEITSEKQSEDYRDYGVSSFAQEAQRLDENGFAAIFDSVAYDGKAGTVHTVDDVCTEENENLLREMMAYCQSQDIELVIVTTPVPESTYKASEEFFLMMHETLSGLCSEYDVSYYDYIMTEGQQLDRSEDSYSDADGHLKESAAEALSADLAERLNTSPVQ